MPNSTRLGGAWRESRLLQSADSAFTGYRQYDKLTLPFLDTGYFFYHNGIAKARRRRSLQHKLHLEKDSRNAQASYDFSSNDPYPYPRYTDDWFNSHGTRCAGEVSAAANNNICGVGVAYNSKGRGGKGSIYVWASGDGGSYDDCNCDGYASSMWTISINSAINDGRTALYDESCSSTLASTFSNGRKRNPEAGVATTDLYGNCTLRHSGTSAAAPEAAGVFALALEANLDLTWRDMQHLTVLTSKRNQLHDEVHQWRRNGVGLEFNHLFGYGVLDAGAMVKMAKDWKTVPERFHCVGGSIQEPDVRKIPPSGKLLLTLTTDACEGKENFVRYLEHVQAVITVNSTRRGDLNINMTSPMGTKSILLSRRPRDDDSKVGFDKWPFMTTHTWGEDPRGTWVLEIGFVGGVPQRGVLKEWTLMLHGTQSAPYIDQIVKDYQSKLAMSKKEELEEELDEAVERSLKSILSKNYLSWGSNSSLLSQTSLFSDGSVGSGSSGMGSTSPLIVTFPLLVETPYLLRYSSSMRWASFSSRSSLARSDASSRIRWRLNSFCPAKASSKPTSSSMRWKVSSCLRRMALRCSSTRARLM
ncbi:Neuroendocrine convertase 2 isoform X3 [Aix galericulata]|nr:Neuroendocrine convertase 2 isoform X3 [Aix galericulata]